MKEDNGYETWVENKRLLDEIYMLGQILKQWRDDQPKPGSLSGIIEAIEQRAALNALIEQQRIKEFDSIPTNWPY